MFGLNIPGFLSVLFARHPGLIYIFVNLLSLSCLIVIVALNDFSTSNPRPEDFFVRSRRATLNNDIRHSVRLAYPPTVDSQQVFQQSDSFRTLTVLSRSRLSENGPPASVSDNDTAITVLSPGVFAQHKRAEDAILNHPDFTKYCIKAADKAEEEFLANPECHDGRVCELPRSFLNHPLLYGVTDDFTGDLCGRRNDSDPVSQADFDEFLEVAFTDDNLRLLFNTDKSTLPSRTAWAARSIINVRSLSNESAEAPDEYAQWAKERANEIEKLSTADHVVRTISGDSLSRTIGGIVRDDLKYAIAAVFLVWFFIYLHTGSIILSLAAMLVVIQAFFPAYIVFRYVLKQLYFGPLQFMAVFLILGIGADDVFVFTDAWKQSSVALGATADTEKRIEWTFERAFKSVTVTSITTSAAFFVSITSSIMPISVLGAWASMLVVFLYLNVISAFPCAIVLSHRLETKLFGQAMVDEIYDEDTGEMVMVYSNTKRQKGIIGSFLYPGLLQPAEGQRHPVERFLEHTWFPIISKLRFGLLVVALVATGFSIFFALRLETPKEQEQLLPRNHPVQSVLNTVQKAFPSASGANLSSTVTVSTFLGADGVDRVNQSRFDRSSPGIPKLDKDFNFTTKAAQQEFLSICQQISRNATQLNVLVVDGKPSVDCWIEDYIKWREDYWEVEPLVTFDDSSEQVLDIIDFATFTEFDGSMPYLRYIRDQHVVFDENNTKVLYTEIRTITNVSTTAPLPDMLQLNRNWRRFTNDLPSSTSEKTRNAGDFAWSWMDTQAELKRSLSTGLITMVIVVFICLGLTTKNWRVTAVTTASIASIVAMLIGVMNGLGMRLGATEMVSVIIASGYSFDGVAHIAAAFVENGSNLDGKERVGKALGDLGVSVIMGALTTVVATAMLFFGTITFFFRFATLVLVTVGLSVGWVFILFPALLAIFA